MDRGVHTAQNEHMHAEMMSAGAASSRPCICVDDHAKSTCSMQTHVSCQGTEVLVCYILFAGGRQNGPAPDVIWQTAMVGKVFGKRSARVVWGSIHKMKSHSIVGEERIGREERGGRAGREGVEHIRHEYVW